MTRACRFSTPVVGGLYAAALVVIVYTLARLARTAAMSKRIM